MKQFIITSALFMVMAAPAQVCSSESVESYQQQLSIEYADPKTSPLMAEDLKTFKALDFYPCRHELLC